MNGAPYWAVYNVGDYTLSPYKVAWAEIGSSLKATLLDNSTNPFSLTNAQVIPDHKLYFAACSTLEDGLFLSGLLNSSIISTIIDQSTVMTSRGDVLKHLHLPKYSSDDRQHNALIGLMNAKVFDQHRVDELVMEILKSFSSTLNS